MDVAGSFLDKKKNQSRPPNNVYAHVSMCMCVYMYMNLVYICVPVCVHLCLYDVIIPEFALV